MTEGQARQDRDGQLGAAEFPPLPELRPGDKLTPLSPRLINPVLRLYNALRKARGVGTTADGKTKLNITVAAAGLVFELAANDQQATDVSQSPEYGGGSGSGAIDYQGAWSSGGSYSVDAIVTHAHSSGQSGLFIRTSGGGGAGTEPFASGYASDWDLIGRIFTEGLVIYNASTRYANFNAQSAWYTFVYNSTAGAQVHFDLTNTICRFQNSSSRGVEINTAGASIGAQSINTWAELRPASDRIRINTTATKYAELTSTGLYAQNNSANSKINYNSDGGTFVLNFAGGGTVTLSNSACSNNAIAIREIDVCDNGNARKMLVVCGLPYDAP